MVDILRAIARKTAIQKRIKRIHSILILSGFFLDHKITERGKEEKHDQDEEDIS